MVRDVIFLLILLLPSCTSTKALQRPDDLFSLSPRDSVRIETWGDKSILGRFKQEKKGVLFIYTENKRITVPLDSVKSVKIIKKGYPKPTVFRFVLFSVFTLLMVGFFVLLEAMRGWGS